MRYFLLGGWVMWIYLISLLAIPFLLMLLIIRSISSRQALRKQLGDCTDISEADIDIQIVLQKRAFHFLFTLVKLIGIVVPFCFIVKMLLGAVRAFDAFAAAGTIDPILFMAGFGETALVWVMALLPGAVAWIIYFIFCSILEGRVLALEKMRAEIRKGRPLQS